MQFLEINKILLMDLLNNLFYFKQMITI